jgi:hypothetical protein
MKTGPDALDTAQNRSGWAKHEKREPAPSLPSKMSPGAQNMQTGLDVLSTVENESWSGKYENGTERPRYRPKLVRKRKT